MAVDPDELAALRPDRLRVFPTATGQGRRLFPDGARLSLVSTEPMGPTTLAIYTPDA